MGSGLLAETHSVVPPKPKGEPLPRSLLGPRQLPASHGTRAAFVMDQMIWSTPTPSLGCFSSFEVRGNPFCLPASHCLS